MTACGAVVMSLQLAADQHVELLIGAADFQIGFQRDGIVTLGSRTRAGSCRNQRLLGREGASRNRRARGVGRHSPSRPISISLATPNSSSTRLLKRISVVSRSRNLERLGAIVSALRSTLFARQRLSRSRLRPVGSADHRSEVTDQETLRGGRILKVAQLLQRQASEPEMRDQARVGSIPSLILSGRQALA